MYEDLTLSGVRRMLDSSIQAFMKQMYAHPSIVEGRAHARQYGQFTMQIPDVGKNTYIVFTPTSEKWHFTANSLSDDYVVVVEGDQEGKGYYWELYHDRHGTGDRLVCLSTDTHPFIRGVNPHQFQAIASCVQTNMQECAGRYTNVVGQATHTPVGLDGREKKILAIIFVAVIVMLGCSGLFLAFLHIGD